MSLSATIEKPTTPEPSAPDKCGAQRVPGEWDGFSVREEELIDAGDTIVTLGRYGGAPKATGKKINSQFAHVWRFKNGKIVAFQQYTDTLQAILAMGL